MQFKIYPRNRVNLRVLSLMISKIGFDLNDSTKKYE